MTRTLLVLTTIIILAPLAAARVWTSVYRCDEATPLAPLDANHPTIYRDIMVGTRLVIVISSDTNEPASGALRLSWDDANNATLSARGYDPESFSYRGSCLEAAGRGATVWDTMDSYTVGLEYYNDSMTAVAGHWFVFDYRAVQVGSVSIELHGFLPGDDVLGGKDVFPGDDVLPGKDILLETLSFTHAASRDLNGDGIVNFEDLALLAPYWRSPVTADPNSSAAAFDLDANGHIDVGDLAPFSAYWLERTDCNEAATGPNDLSSPL
jgi:hypothetical protein